MRAWRQSDASPFNFFDAHDLNTARDGSLELSIKSQLSVRLKNTKVFVSLVGEKTRYLRKFVLWEIEQAVNRDIPIVVVNLNKKRAIDFGLCPASLRDELAVHIPYNSKILQYALENWPDSHAQYRKARETGPHHFRTGTYTSLGI